VTSVKVSLLLVAAAALIFGASPARALENPKVFRGILLLEGKIVRGDYDRLRAFLSDKTIFDKINGGVFLASPGGDVAEAIRIGRLIRALNLSTEAPSGRPTANKPFAPSIEADDLVNPRQDAGCASACFLLFVSGIYRNINWAGRLGVHRPFRVRANMQPVRTSADPFVDIAVRHAIESYLREMDVPAKYADLMFSTAPNKVRWITQEELDSDLDGLIPELKKHVDVKCGGPALPKSIEQHGGEADCRADLEWRLRAELPGKAWPLVFGEPGQL